MTNVIDRTDRLHNNLSNGINGSIERGVIRAVYPSKGLCEVVTSSGRKFLSHMVGAGGPTGMGSQTAPMAGTPCLLAIFDLKNSFVLSTYQMTTEEEFSVGSFGAPGDFQYSAGGGGHMLMSQSGLFDIMADPWARLSIMPEDKTIKMVSKNLDISFSPTSFLRVIQDDEDESQFLELFVNSRFLYRPDDPLPDVSFTLGNATTSSKAKETNPRSPFLASLYTEARSDVSAETKFRRSTFSLGNVAGVGLEEKIENIEEETSYIRQVGSIEGGEDGPQLMRTEFGLATPGDKTSFSVEDSGRIVVTTPDWEINISSEEIVITNTQTSLVLRGDEIYVGGEEGSQKMALGEDLLRRIEGLESFVRTHNHLHPHGPTTGVIGSPSGFPDFLSDVNHVT